MILLISISHVARFTGVSHRYLAYFLNFKVFFEVLGLKPRAYVCEASILPLRYAPPSFMVRFKYCPLAYLEAYNIQLMTELFPLLYNRFQNLSFCLTPNFSSLINTIPS
jgi:hypothetical protein